MSECVGGNQARDKQRPMENKIEINGVRFLKHGVKDAAGKYYPAQVCRGEHISGIECITVYAKSYYDGLPIELQPQNDTDSCTDYFEKDRVRFLAGSAEFAALEAIAR